MVGTVPLPICPLGAQRSPFPMAFYPYVPQAWGQLWDGGVR